MYRLQEDDLFVNIAISKKHGEFIYNAGRAVPAKNEADRRLPIEDHEQIISMVEDFLTVAKQKLEEEKKIRVMSIKRCC